MLDICLVSMPYTSLSHASLGIHLLLAAARQKGLTAHAVYPVLWFAETIGLETYAAVDAIAPAEELIGEWTFSKAAFPDYTTHAHTFVEQKIASGILDIEKFHAMYGTDADVCTTLLAVREQAVSFIYETAERILALDPKIVGCSSSFQQHCASLALLRVVKLKAPHVVTLMGGANCEGVMAKANKRAFPWIDFVVSGEADVLFPHLCTMILTNKAMTHPEELPHGVVGTHNMHCDEGDANRATIPTMDDTLHPDYDDYFEARKTFKYIQRVPYTLLMIEASRGCWWGATHPCTFCGVNGTRRTFRKKDAQRVYNELEQLHKRHNVRSFVFTDNILSMDYCTTLLPMLAARTPAPYLLHWEVKANLTEEQIALLARAGVRHIQAGIEHFHNDALHLLNKGVTALQNIALLIYAMEHGIQVSWNFLCMIPGEQSQWYEEIAHWLPRVFHLQPPTGVVPIRFDRFSEYYMHQERYGLHLTPRKEYAAVYPVSPDDLNDMAYFFETGDDRYASFQTKPGIASLIARVKEWTACFMQYFDPNICAQLTVREEADQSHITDTRPCAQQKHICLTGLEHWVHRECRAPLSKTSLPALLREHNAITVSQAECDSALRSLEEKNLVLCLNGNVLRLALSKHHAPLLTAKELVMGNVEFTHVLDGILIDKI